jgi:putative ABC transport system substrate-binding protein
MSYGTTVAEGLRLTAVFVDKILRGAKPGDLPVEQPSRLELVVNLATAKTLDFNTRERSCCRQTT